MKINGNKIEGFVFDMDGLLLDSERIVQRSWELSGKELGIEGMGQQIYHTLGMNAKSRSQYFKNAISASRSSLLMFLNKFFDASPSPPCHMMASVRLRARPSCRK